MEQWNLCFGIIIVVIIKASQQNLFITFGVISVGEIVAQVIVIVGGRGGKFCAKPGHIVL